MSKTFVFVKRRMELPFAVDPESQPVPSMGGSSGDAMVSGVERATQDDDASLVTASSHGSLLEPTIGDSLTSLPEEENPIVDQTVSIHLEPQVVLQTPPVSIPPNPNNPIQSPPVVLQPPTSNTSYTHHPTSGYQFPSRPPEPVMSTAAKQAAVLTSSLFSTGSRMATAAFSQLATATTSASQKSIVVARKYPQQRPQASLNGGIDGTDHTYVNVWETDADEVDVVLPRTGLSGVHGRQSLDELYRDRGDILGVLLSDVVNSTTVQLLEQANEMVHQASQSKHDGDLSKALDSHTTAAKFFYQAAMEMKNHKGT